MLLCRSKDIQNLITPKELIWWNWNNWVLRIDVKRENILKWLFLDPNWKSFSLNRQQIEISCHIFNNLWINRHVQIKLKRKIKKPPYPKIKKILTTNKAYLEFLNILTKIRILQKDNNRKRPFELVRYLLLIYKEDSS